MEEKQEIKSGDVGSMEEVFGKDDSMFQSEEKPVVVDLTTTQEEVTEHQDLTSHELHVAENETPEDFGKDEAGKPELQKELEKEVVKSVYKDIPVEVPIEYLLNMETGNVFPVNDTIIKQRHLKPCDKDGRLIHDSRRIFNGMR